jgi:hypothetical protein
MGVDQPVNEPMAKAENGANQDSEREKSGYASARFLKVWADKRRIQWRTIDLRGAEPQSA